MSTILIKYGLSSMGALPCLAPGQYLARVLIAASSSCRAASERGEETLAYGRNLGTPGREDGLCAGDFIVVQDAQGGPVAQALLPRRSVLRRLSAQIGPEHEQLIAANMDLTLIVTSANREFNEARLLRYLAAIWDGGSQPVIALTKCDLIPDPARWAMDVERRAPGVEVYPISGVTGLGLPALIGRISGLTSALVGSSGVGKSTLMNAIAGREHMKTQRIREDDAHGRHTTTHRELLLCGEAILIDTPGMREFGLWDGDLDQAFPDILSLAQSCRFSDCRHDKEPECAVKAAIASGELDEKRARSYQKLLADQRRRQAKRQPT